MISRSYTNLLDLAAGNFSAAAPRPRQRSSLPRSMTLPTPLSELESDDERYQSSDVGGSSVAGVERLIVVSNFLPIVVSGASSSSPRSFSFQWDEQSLQLQLKAGLPDDVEVLFVGCLKANIPASQQEEVAATLLDQFHCAAVFLPDEVYDKYYHAFCKGHLWPLFHYMLPFSSPTDDAGSGERHSFNKRFDRAAWEGYVLANKLFFEKVVEIINIEDDYVWVHDYHLMALPTFLRRKFNRLRLGFFLHSPFPSSEIYRTLPVRDEILKAMLNCDLIGFHTFDYARHFLSCCSRMLGLEYQSKRGYIGLEYFGRTVGIKIMPVGVHMGQLQSALRLPDKERHLAELGRQFDGKTVLLGVDDMDIFKGINLKLLAFENMLEVHPKWRGLAVLVQIVNPPRVRRKDLELMQEEIKVVCDRINDAYGGNGYSPVVLIEREVSRAEKVAYYTLAECVVVTAVRDGMNLTPYEYVVCREGILENEVGFGGPKKSMLVLSEFIGCSPSLSGAMRVNPWNIEATSEAMNEAISMPDSEKQLRHEKHYRYISTHDVAFWSRSFIQDLERTCKDHFRRTCWGIGLGFGFRVVALDPNFRKLNLDSIVSSYDRAKSRAILLDYDGTLVPQTSLNKAPNEEVVDLLNELCADEKNVVFVVSGRGRESLGRWFSECPKLGIAAEHGYFLRWSSEEEWESSVQISDFGWMQMAEPVMKLYTEATDGSYLETKESALVWHHQDADPGFGSGQAKEMLDHLESVLANEPVSVKSGQYIVEVKPQAVSKGFVAGKILASMLEKGTQAEFVLCVGDDRSDEDMFEQIAGTVRHGLVAPGTQLFGCTVGQKPSKAKYYLDDTAEVLSMLKALAEASGPSSSTQLADDPAASLTSLSINDEQISYSEPRTEAPYRGLSI